MHNMSSNLPSPIIGSTAFFAKLLALSKALHNDFLIICVFSTCHVYNVIECFVIHQDGSYPYPSSEHLAPSRECYSLPYAYILVAMIEFRIARMCVS